jgi:YegS/Rv2252/BmrU family lipid kinase
VRICVIFNPAARGDKARRFRERLNSFAEGCVFKPTTEPGTGSTLAAEAVAEGFDTIVAAGGDGTINEVVNGIAQAESGFERARLGVLPLGTVNVFAKDLGIPQPLEKAWGVIQSGRETRIDLPQIEYEESGTPAKRFFAQLAGAGLDARAIQQVNWNLKKQVGPLAYVYAGLQAMFDRQPTIRVSNGTGSYDAQLVLLGNGRFYGGRFDVFPGADFRDGLVDACLFERVDWGSLMHSGTTLLTVQRLPERNIRHLRAASFELNGPPGTPFEVDGELAGTLPAKISVQKERLRVIVP